MVSYAAVHHSSSRALGTRGLYVLWNYHAANSHAATPAVNCTRGGADWPKVVAVGAQQPISNFFGLYSNVRHAINKTERHLRVAEVKSFPAISKSMRSVNGDQNGANLKKWSVLAGSHHTKFKERRNQERRACVHAKVGTINTFVHSWNEYKKYGHGLAATATQASKKKKKERKPRELGSIKSSLTLLSRPASGKKKGHRKSQRRVLTPRIGSDALPVLAGRGLRSNRSRR